MRTSIRRMGNLAAIILPKPFLTELGVKAGDDVLLTVETARIILEPVRAHPRGG